MSRWNGNIAHAFLWDLLRVLSVLKMKKYVGVIVEGDVRKYFSGSERTFVESPCLCGASLEG
eukprot:TRINITY_DN5655_c0_g1_i1.p1 TRINITY_DN5655_c0_g1~~TRINITY_DN5655_c0_g1_i1.p1  ORF type:complete len:62 (+),score=9.95 TRINITY_DN5655_c0_g1_i1:23-208(+)